MTNLIKAVNEVMNEVTTIDKNKTVGEGRFAYKAVSDADVKLNISRAMRKNGLAIFQTDVEEKVTRETWEENNNGQVKMKSQVYVQTKTKYKLYHESGEFIELAGSGHGLDTQDKAAGKATTYALKYVLLYTFMVATGAIDDSDSHYEAPQVPPQTEPQPQTETGEVISEAQRKMLYALGKEVYGEEISVNLKRLVSAITKGTTDSIAELTKKQASKLIDGLNAKRAEVTQ